MATTIVNVQTNIGSFKLRLFEDKAPATVAQFLAHLEAGNYQFSMIHEALSDYATGGLFTYESCFQGPVPVPALPTIPVEATGLSNTANTIALARDLNDSSAVGGQWVINLNNNENAYNPAVKPVVFGEVIEGFTTLNQLSIAWTVGMNVSLSVPTVNYSGIFFVNCSLFTRDNVIKTAMQVEIIEEPVADPANVFDESSSTLNIKVDTGSEGLLALSLTLQSTDPSVIVQAQPETVVSLSAPVEGMATFDAATGNLTIPELVVNGQVAYTNLVFQLTDSENLFFALQSFGNP
ncbi:MAG: peptidylprolyl isomerase [Proteobacteria bacterium]|nr:peptidylprolyl isomerase [Pseudomonadota bacterium]MDA0929522.1 peptidylprolyl isomerase [Pseudomonadota bacterium]